MVLICGINCVLYRTIHFFRDDSFGSFEVRIITGCGTSVVINKAFRHLTLYSQDLICNSPYYLPYNSYHVNLENLGLGQLKSPNCYFSLFSSLVCLILY